MADYIIIGGKQFRFVSAIAPKVDDHGRILEECPAPRYLNVKNLPLHKYGGGPFCRFKLESSVDGFGVYAIVDESSKVLYIGKCTGPTSTLQKRFNNGYGSIQPRNCYVRGQSTNCRVNRLVLGAVKAGKRVSVFYYETQRGQEAIDLEKALIRQVGKPAWNINEPW